MIRIQVVVFIVAILFSCSAFEKPEPRDYSEWIKFEEKVSNLKTAKAISEYMLQNLRYTSRKKGERAESQKHGYSWKRPADTFVDKYGFCYDLSAFSLYALLKNGYSEARLMFACWGDWGNKSSTGHFVTFFKEDNKYYVINNGKYQGPFNSLDQIEKVAAGGRNIKHTRTFRFDKIPFGIRYSDMEYFCSD
ncbi:MAG: hypothetical protein HKO79_05115 [Desulfobacterales bacterium]|nr:hypothetical protein [Deltaproteobacteria bacterium]NNK85430.1 hypothetical protein [Desulfobacterales bacterium]NNL41852.1 hypothetical protein [Desulfobacterales bacterium]